MSNARKSKRPGGAPAAAGAQTATNADSADSLRAHAQRSLSAYFDSLNGLRPSGLYALVIREVEEPLFRAVLQYTEGNQVRAAEVLGINRGTLRRKLEEYGLVP